MLCNRFRQLHILRAVASFAQFHQGPRSVLKMAQEVKVYRASAATSGGERLDITFQYQAEGNGKSRVFNLSRPADEELSKCLARISANVTKRARKRKKVEMAEGNDKELEVCLLRNDERIDGDLQNELAWTTGAVLKIGTIELPVRENPPTILKLSIPSTVMSHFGIYPSIDCSFTDLKDSVYSWRRSKSKRSDSKENVGSEPVCDEQTSCDNRTETPHDTDKGSDSDVSQRLKPGSSSGETSRVNQAESEWEEISQSPRYFASDDDVGHCLKLVVTPMLGSAEGDATESNSTAVYRGPSFCPFERRHLLTQEYAPPNCFRIISYNILANLYADSDYSRGFLFSYCPEYALAAHYRYQLVLKEILGYKADIVCLQEVDRSFFHNELTDAMEQAESPYAGLLALKPCDVGEGEATFYRKEAFGFVASHDIDMMQAFQMDPIHAELFSKVAVNTTLQAKLLERKCVLQVTVLESTDAEKRKVLVATSHFYFHPIADNIRLLQMAISLRHIETVVQQYKEKGDNLAVTLMGDLNSSRLRGVFQLATTNHVPANIRDWYAVREEYIPGMGLTHSLNLISACGEPDYTLFTVSFAGVLDHMFIDGDQLRMKRVIPMPAHEDVVRYTALPNAVFPSDHLPLICDVEWGEELAIVFGGDFNSSPMYGVCRLATLGHIPANAVDWYSAGIEQYLPDMTLKHGLSLTSACGEAPYTNFVGSFHGALDHIFIDAERLQTNRIIPLPEHEEVIAHTALPNPVFPSDHLALVCDIEWIK